MGNAGLLILNVSDLSNPQLLSIYSEESGSATSIAVLGNAVFLANAYGGSLILNMNDPSHPQLLSTYPSGNGRALGVAVSSNIVFMANGNAGLYILSTSNRWQLKIRASPSFADASNYPLNTEGNR